MSNSSNSVRVRRQVRKSRALGIPLTPKAEKYFERRPYAPGEHGRARRKQDSDYKVRPVSYTHLTLPTILRV